MEQQTNDSCTEFRISVQVFGHNLEHNILCIFTRLAVEVSLEGRGRVVSHYSSMLQLPIPCKKQQQSEWYRFKVCAAAAAHGLSTDSTRVHEAGRLVSRTV
ncbi:hypothetical protein Mapa_016144 [Marchantia paleacea]|nr:hypothetical protein Mapa_016144 [Marchantia paleacea]